MLDNELPEVKNGFSVPYRHRRSFEEIFASIQLAKKFIYISGWDVNAELDMVRSSPPATELKPKLLGELLHEKAAQGCQVLIMIWDDPTNNSFVVKNGIMATFDEKTSL